MPLNSDWPIWCEIVCLQCAAKVAGQFNWRTMNKNAKMFVIKASTPEAMRDQIVKWLNQQASNHRIAAAKLSGIRKMEIELARAGSYEGAAKFLEGCSVDNGLIKDGHGFVIKS